MPIENILMALILDALMRSLPAPEWLLGLAPFVMSLGEGGNLPSLPAPAQNVPGRPTNPMEQMQGSEGAPYGVMEGPWALLSRFGRGMQLPTPGEGM
jgi:hypothetical protein